MVDESGKPLKLEVGQQVDVWLQRKRGDRLIFTMVKPRNLFRDLHRGDEVLGTIVQQTVHGDFFVDIGYVRQVMLRARDIAGLDLEEVKPGMDVKVRIKDMFEQTKDINVRIGAG